MRLIEALFILLFCSGCGFKPLYYAKVRQDVLTNVGYERIDDDVKNPRATFFLNNEIEKILNTNERETPKYLLKVSYDVSVDDYLIQNNSTTSMKKMQVTLSYAVTEFEGRAIAASGKLTNFDSFSMTEFPYSDFVNEEDLTIRILLSLVQELRLQLLSKLTIVN